MQKRSLNICKKTLAAFFLLLLCARLFARSGMLSGEKNLRVSKTRWFDIIYPERCQESAAILYEKADKVYDEVTAQYGLSPVFRMPVVITPAVDQFNAFWTALPYNHIAIYDTGYSGSSELAVFSETLISTFRHELTHAVTYNMKDGFWRFVGNTFGDCVTPGMLTITTGMAEGATVTSESAAGEGRLNDEFARHYVKQAKIEGSFPSYHDVSGASDIVPGGAPYYFNGAFHQWLQDKYGMAAYANFWYLVVNGKTYTIAGAFKKAYGLKLKKAWKAFEESYEVPEVAPNPVSAGQAADFFEAEKNDYSEQNAAGSMYSSLTSALVRDASTNAPVTRLVWLDQAGGRVFAADSNVSGSRKLFSMRGINSVRLSNDGRLLAVSYISENAATSSGRVKIYDIENKRFFSVPEKGLKEALVVAVPGEPLSEFSTRDAERALSELPTPSAPVCYYLVGQKYLAQHYSIYIAKINFSEDGRSIKALEPCTEIPMPVETNPFAFTALGDGSFAFLKKEGLKYSLCIASVDGWLLKEFAFEEGMSVRSLAYSEKEKCFSFSYARKNTMPRPGLLNVESGELRLFNQDISGGVFEPVLNEDDIVYIGKFYRQNRLLSIKNINTQEWLSSSLNQNTIQDSVDVENLPFKEGRQFNTTLPSKSYNPFPYLTQGIFIPVSTYQTEYFGINADYVSNAGTSYLGFTWLTANPWTEGSSDLYLFTSGWNALSNAVGLELQIKKGTATSLFSSQLDIKSEFDSKGWKVSGGNLSLSSNVYAGRISSISLSNSSEAYIGRQETRFPEYYENPESENYKSLPTIAFWDKEIFGITAPQDDILYYKLLNITSINYSNIRRWGPGRFEYAGFSAGLIFGARYDASLEEDSFTFVNATAFGGEAKIYIPHLLPFESKYGYTYNLPLRLTGLFLPSDSIYGYVKPEKVYGRVLFDALAETTLFSMDIQKALPVITALYINDFYISAGYAASGTAAYTGKTGFQNKYLGTYFSDFASGKGFYYDSVYVKTAMEFTPNIGVFASSNYKMTLLATYSYVLHSPENLKAVERFRMTIGFNLQ